MTASPSRPVRASGPQNDRPHRPGSSLARRRVRFVLVATTLLALLTAPALVGTTAAEHIVETDGSTASASNPTAHLQVTETEPVAGEPFRVVAEGTGNVTNSSLDYGGGETLFAGSWLIPELSNGSRSQLHTYTEPGDYVITFTVRNESGATDTVRETVHVRPEEAEIEARLESTYEGAGSGPHENRTVEFDASGTVGNVSEYVWFFGDGNFERTSGPTTTHDYRQNGSYEALVIAVGPNATGRASARVTLGSTVQDARITTSHENVTVHDEVWFQVEPTLGSVREYRWQFSDGSRTDDRFAYTTRSWAEPGTYTASVTLVPFDGEPKTLQRSVTVESGGPSIDVTVEPDRVVAGRPVRLNATSENTSFTDYDWTVGDDRTETTFDPSIWHVFDEPGQHTVEVAGTDGYLGGPGAVATENVTVPEGPNGSYDLEADISTTTPVTYLPVRLEATAPDWTPTEYWWKTETAFGQQWHRTEDPSFVHEFGITENETVTVVAVRDNATARTTTTQFSVGRANVYTVDVAPEDPVVGENATLSVEKLAGQVTNVTWYVDGDSIGSGLSVRHSFDDDLQYGVVAEGTTVAGDSWRASEEVSVQTAASDGEDSSDDAGDGGGTFLVPTKDTSPAAPSFEIQSVDVPEDVEPGSDVEVTVETANDGGAGDGEVTLGLADGAQQSVGVSAGSDEMDAVTTTVAAPADPGEYDLEVQTASDEQTATLSVAGSAGEDGTGENETDAAPSSSDDSSVDDSTPAFGVVGSLLGIVASVLAVRWRS